jgi:hypothetical protein
MNKRQRKVFTLLRTKTKAIGLNRKELEGLALKIDKNLQLEEDASDEEVDAAIEEAVDAALPFLEVSQSVAQRSIQSTLQRMRDQNGDDDDDEDDPDDDDQDDGDGDRNVRQRGKNKKNHRTSKSSSEDSEIMKFLKEQNDTINALKVQLDNLQGDRVHDTRRAKLKKLVENTGTFGKSVLKQFDLMSFKDDEAFDDYLDEVQKDLDDLNQERANEGLKKLGEVPAGKGKKSPENQEVDVLADDDIIALAGGKKETK